MELRADAATAVADTARIRRTLGGFATGVTVVTVGGDTPHGMTANSFTGVSLDPPLVLICVERHAVMHQCLLHTRSFGVSVLGGGQEHVARYFADRRRPLGIDQFGYLDWVPGERTGAPLITDAVAQVECDLWRTYDGGDHTIFVGRLLSLRHRTEEGALVFLNGAFRQLDSTPDRLPG